MSKPKPAPRKRKPPQPNFDAAGLPKKWKVPGLFDTEVRLFMWENFPYVSCSDWFFLSVEVVRDLRDTLSAAIAEAEGRGLE